MRGRGTRTAGLTIAATMLAAGCTISTNGRQEWFIRGGYELAAGSTANDSQKEAAAGQTWDYDKLFGWLKVFFPPKAAAEKAETPAEPTP